MMAEQNVRVTSQKRVADALNESLLGVKESPNDTMFIDDLFFEAERRLIAFCYELPHGTSFVLRNTESTAEAHLIRLGDEAVVIFQRKRHKGPWGSAELDRLHEILLEFGGHRVTPEGEWSAPLAKAEIARRVNQDDNARWRDVESIFKHVQVKPVSKKRVCVRLDQLDSHTRKKIETPLPPIKL